MRCIPLLDADPTVPIRGAVDGRSFWRPLFGQLLLSGERLCGVGFGRGGRAALNCMCCGPTGCVVVPGADGWPIAYEYSVGGKKHVFPRGLTEPRRSVTCEGVSSAGRSLWVVADAGGGRGGRCAQRGVGLVEGFVGQCGAAFGGNRLQGPEGARRR